MKAITVSSPGRINIIGEHTDYNDGFVLPAAVDKKCVFTVRRNGDPHRITIKALNVGNDYTFDLRDYAPRKEGGWENYVRGVVSELEKLGAKIRDAQLQKVPYMLVIGDRELETNTVAVRTRSGEDLGSMSLEDLSDRLADEIASRGHAVLED